MAHFWCYRLLYSAVLVMYWSSPATARDVDPERLGNPLAEKGEYARVVWDLQRYRGRIYLGGGSTLTNGGPIPVTAYDPSERTFITDPVAARPTDATVLQEEAIDLYRVFAGALYTPAADPRNPVNDDLSKFYRRDAGVWVRYASGADLPTAHVRDLYRYDDGLIVAVGNSRGIEPDADFVPGAVYSDDDGRSFRPAIDKRDLIDRSGVFFSLFAYRGKLFATTTYFSRAPALDALGVYVFDRERRRLLRDPEIGNRTFLPLEDDFDRRIILQPWLPVEYRGVLLYPVKARLIYEAGGGLIEVEQYRQASAFYSKNGLNAAPRAVRFPDPAAIGEDVVTADALYVLANRLLDNGQYRVYLYRSETPADPEGWREVLRFDSVNIAKSLEILDGHAYFGLGREAADPLADAGALLRAALPSSAPALFDDQFESAPGR